MTKTAPNAQTPLAEETEPGRPQMPPIARYLTLGGLVTALLVVAVAASTLWQGRRDTWNFALRESENLRQGIIGYMDQHMRLYRQSLDLAVRALRAPESEGLSDKAKSAALEAIAQNTDYVSGIMQIDASGHSVRSTLPVPAGVNFSDRSYFTVQRDNPHVGVYISPPFRSRLSNELIIALSRRLDDADGNFAGVVLVAARLAFIEAFLADIDMGPHGALLLLSADGQILARQRPNPGQGPIGTDLSQSPVFKKIKEMGTGFFVGTARVDGVRRLYTFAPVPGQPFIVNVAPALEDIFAAWWHRTLVIGLLTLATCALIVVLTVLLRQELGRRVRTERELWRLSLTDALTGLPNRRRYDEVIRREWRRTQRTGAPLALLLLDADEFKKLNDRYGHAMGDEVLKALARTVEASIRRPGDVAARYGGEEFAVVLPDTTGEGAVNVAETIRSACETLDGSLPPFTVSIGVTATYPSADQPVEAFLEAADKAMYQAKLGGRNRVVLAA